MKAMWSEFKAFALSGNMFDLALGFIIGAAFSGLVQSLAKDVIMQLVAAVAGKADFSDLVFTLNGSEIRYGSFLTVLVNFVLLAAVLFIMVKILKRVGLGTARKEESGRDCPYCTERVPETARKCKWCTADIDPVKEPEKSVAPTG